MAKQTEFAKSKYKTYKSPDICAVCHAPAATREVVEPSHARMRYTGRKAKTRTEVAFFHVGVTKNLKGTQRPVLVKLCEKHAQENASGTESHEATYHDPRTAAGYRWWFQHGQLPLWGKAQYEIDAEEAARKLAEVRQGIENLRNGVLALPYRAQTHTDPRESPAYIARQEWSERVSARVKHAQDRQPDYMLVQGARGVWLRYRMLATSLPVIELPASTPEPEPPTPAISTDARTLPAASVTLNKHNVWVFFEAAPDPVVRAQLKAAGMRYSHNKRGWWVSVNMSGASTHAPDVSPKGENMDISKPVSARAMKAGMKELRAEMRPWLDLCDTYSCKLNKAINANNKAELLCGRHGQHRTGYQRACTHAAKCRAELHEAYIALCEYAGAHGKLVPLAPLALVSEDMSYVEYVAWHKAVAA